ncbi:MAG: hypothetical protein K6G34_09350 [Lachnospiraceae bacterium]|nr:hypothetical protein [Lachnospiraceae bacterium]
MYAVSEGKIKINDRMVETYGRAVLGKETALHVVAGSTGYKGSNKREAGGRTYLRLDCCCGDFYFEPIVDEDRTVTGVEIACCGDEGLDAIMKALEFIRTVINDQRCEVDD